jgi:hypothetical protein
MDAVTIPAYQIHNVLKNFSKRLLAENGGGGLPAPGSRPGIQCADIAADGKRRAVTATVTAEIFNRLTRSALCHSQGGEDDVLPAPENEPANTALSQFNYRLIDSRNRTIALSFSLEDPEVLIGRLEEVQVAETKSKLNLPHTSG